MAVMTGTFLFLEYRLDQQADPIYAALAQMGAESASAAPALPPATGVPTGPTLRQLLAEEESRGTLGIEENGPQTRITLKAPELFASASAALDRRYGQILHEVGAAIEKVPGHVIIEGHTDDQPLRSFAFRDNYELSRARAQKIGRAHV